MPDEIFSIISNSSIGNSPKINGLGKTSLHRVSIKKALKMKKKLKNALHFIKNKKRKILPLAAGALLILLPVIYLGLKNTKEAKAASDIALSSNSTQVQIDVPNRYRAVIQKGDTTDFIVFSDRAQNDTSPNPTHEFRGPCIVEAGATYCLRDDENRFTYVLENTPARVRIRVEGRFANEATTGYLAATSGGNITVQVNYTFTNDGVFVENKTDFKGGLGLDADSGHNGYEWLGVYTDVTDAAFDDTANIIYGNGVTEATTSTDAAEFDNTNLYVVLPGTGSNTYQDAYIGIMNGGWYNDTGGVREWHWDENETGTQDSINAQQQNYTASGQNTAMWFFFMLPESDTDTETKRELIINDEQSFDTLHFYGRGTQGTDSSGDSYNRREGAYMIDADTLSEAKFGLSGSRYNPGFKFKNYRKPEIPEEISLNGEKVDSTAWKSSVKPISSALFMQDLTFYTTFENSAAVTSPDTGSGGTYGASAATGRYGNGLLIDNNNDDTFVPMSGNVPDTVGTVDFWFSVTGSARPNIVLYSSSDGSISTNFSLSRNGNTATLTFRVGGGSQNITPNIDIFDLRWHHIVFAYDTVADTMALYVDGISQGSFSVSMNTIPLGSNNLYFGMEGDGAGNTINGVLDEFKIYSEYLPTKIAYGGDTSETNEYLGDPGTNYTLDFAGVDSNGRGEYLFLGSDSKFAGVNVDLATKGVEAFQSDAGFTWEYWNGTAWSTLTVTEQDYGTSNFTNNGNFYFTPPANWALISIGDTHDLYYIRGSMGNGDSFQTFPVENTIKTDILVLQHYQTTTKDDETYFIPAEYGEYDLGKGTSPTAYWMFDDGSGSTAQDTTDNNNDLTINGATWGSESGAEFLRRNYLSFDGTNDYVSRTDDGDFNFGTGSFTYTGWFRHNNTISGTDTVLSHFGTAGYKVYMNSTGNICFGIDDDSTWGPDDAACSSNSFGDMSDNTWHHFAAVMDDSEDTITIYINGQQAGQKSGLVATSSLNTASTLYLGIDSNGTSNPWHGDLDQVVLYSYARTAEQIKTDMSTPQTTSFVAGGTGASADNDMIHWWRFDEANGDNANDAVGSNTGNLANAGTCPGNAGCPTWVVPAKYESGLDFDGTNDHVKTASVPVNINTTGDSIGTIAFWMQPDWVSTTTTSTRTVFAATNESSDGMFVIFCGSDSSCASSGLGTAGDLMFSVVDNGATQSKAFISNSNYSWAIDEWMHVAVTWDDTSDDNDNMEIYLNGHKITQSRTSASSLDVSTPTLTNFFIGASSNGQPQAVFDGTIDDFKIYDAQLNQSQIQVAMQANSAVNFGQGSVEGDAIVDGAGNGPTLWWKFDENTGTSSTVDSSGNNLGGSMTGFSENSWIKGQQGAALQFDGSTTSVERSDNALLDFNDTDDFTITAWFYRSSFSSDHAIVAKALDASAVDRAGYMIYIDDANDDIVFYVGDGSDEYYVDGTTAITSEGWNHVAVVWDENNAANTRIYLNGFDDTQGTTGTQSSIGSLENTRDFKVGTSQSNTNRFDGRLDDIKVYRYAMTPAQIAYQYNRGEPLAWWRLDECGSTTAYDSNANTYPGTITIGTSGTHTSAGSCGSSLSNEAWNNGSEGRYNASLDLDGTDDFITVTDTTKLRFNSSAQDFTIMGWVKREASGATHYIISKEDANNDGWFMQYTSGNLIRCGINSTAFTSTSTITDTEWHHLACTYDRDGLGQVYLDGRKDGNATTISGITMATTSNITLGKQSYASSGYLNGKIDEIRIYNYVLSEAQIRAAMNLGRASFGF